MINLAHYHCNLLFVVASQCNLKTSFTSAYGRIILPPPPACKGSVIPESRGGEEEAQAKETCAEPQLLFHGRQVPRLVLLRP